MRYSQRPVRVVAHSDGSCNNHPKAKRLAKVGGVGLIMSLATKDSLEWKEFADGPFLQTTSARMEIRGLLRALEESPLGSDILIHIDNQYVVYTIQKGWLANWVATNSLEGRKNDDLWRKVLELYDRHITSGSIVNLEWVKGHNGDPLNEKADRLAEEGRNKKENPIVCENQYAKK